MNTIEQGALGNIVKPDFPDQCFYSDLLSSVSNGPTEEDSIRLNISNYKTDKLLNKIKSHAETNELGMNPTGFSALDELEYLFSDYE